MWWESWTVGGVQAPVSAAECQQWRETKGKIIVSSREWLPSLPLFSANKAPFTICISFNVTGAEWQGDAPQPFYPPHKYTCSSRVTNTHDASQWIRPIAGTLPSENTQNDCTRCFVKLSARVLHQCRTKELLLEYSLSLKTITQSLWCGEKM